jgi:hypothetical protein
MAAERCADHGHVTRVHLNIHIVLGSFTATERDLSLPTHGICVFTDVKRRVTVNVHSGLTAVHLPHRLRHRRQGVHRRCRRSTSAKPTGPGRHRGGPRRNPLDHLHRNGGPNRWPPDRLLSSVPVTRPHPPGSTPPSRPCRTPPALALETVVDWARWTMYGDTAARDRLPADAAGSKTKWKPNWGDTPAVLGHIHPGGPAQWQSRRDRPGRHRRGTARPPDHQPSHQPAVRVRGRRRRLRPPQGPPPRLTRDLTRHRSGNRASGALTTIRHHTGRVQFASAAARSPGVTGDSSGGALKPAGPSHIRPAVVADAGWEDLVQATELGSAGAPGSVEVAGDGERHGLQRTLVVLFVEWAARDRA